MKEAMYLSPIEKLCRFLADESERQGALHWTEVDPVKTTVRMGAVLQDDEKTIEKANADYESVKNEVYNWLAISGAKDVVDLVQKYFHIMLLTYLDPKAHGGRKLIYNHIKNERYFKYVDEPEDEGEHVLETFKAKKRAETFEEAANRVNNIFGCFYNIFVNSLQEIAQAEIDFRFRGRDVIGTEKA